MSGTRGPMKAETATETPPVDTKKENSSRPKLNGELLTPEEQAMPMGTGYLAAAERLDLIYLADPVAMANLLSHFAGQAIHLYNYVMTGLLTSRQYRKAVNELIDHLAEIFRGQNPRFMAIPWFTDPAQLREKIFKMYEADYKESGQEEYAELQADPIAVEVGYFLDCFVDSSMEDEPDALTKAIDDCTRGILGIPAEVPLPIQYRVAERKVVTAVRVTKEEAPTNEMAQEYAPKVLGTGPERFVRQVLKMVRELHKMGYESLRITPYISFTGKYWRCMVAPSSKFSQDHGALLAASIRKPEKHLPFYTTGQESKYFGWEDATDDDPVRLAEKFVARFPKIVARCKKPDPAYVQWYEEMLRVSEPYGVVYAFDATTDSHEQMYIADNDRATRFQKPPPGAHPGFSFLKQTRKNG